MSDQTPREEKTRILAKQPPLDEFAEQPLADVWDTFSQFHAIIRQRRGRDASGVRFAAWSKHHQEASEANRGNSRNSSSTRAKAQVEEGVEGGGRLIVCLGLQFGGQLE